MHTFTWIHSFVTLVRPVPKPLSVPSVFAAEGMRASQEPSR